MNLVARAVPTRRKQAAIDFLCTLQPGLNCPSHSRAFLLKLSNISQPGSPLNRFGAIRHRQIHRLCTS